MAGSVSSKQWFVYIVRCADNSLYTGIARDVAKRIEDHNTNNASAAKYTRARRPVRLVYQETCGSHSHAARREYEIKQLSRTQKEALLVSESVCQPHV